MLERFMFNFFFQPTRWNVMTASKEPQSPVQVQWNAFQWYISVVQHVLFHMKVHPPVVCCSSALDFIQSLLWLLLVMSYVVFVEGSSVVGDISIKGCVLAEDMGSVNYGVTKNMYTSYSCSTNRCNNRPAPGNVLSYFIIYTAFTFTCMRRVSPVHLLQALFVATVEVHIATYLHVCDRVVECSGSI